MQQSSADAMFGSAAEVLGTLVDRAVTAGPSTPAASESSIRVEPDKVATLTEIPSAGFSFVAEYSKGSLAKVVELMLGTPSGDGEMDAMQLSIVSETVAQISSAMAERLTQELKTASENITSTVPTEASAFPAPPFASFTSVLDVAGEFKLTVALAFDGVALAKLEPKAAAPEPAAARAAAAPPPSRPAAPPPTSSRRRLLRWRRRRSVPHRRARPTSTWFTISRSRFGGAGPNRDVAARCGRAAKRQRPRTR